MMKISIIIVFILFAIGAKSQDSIILKNRRDTIKLLTKLIEDDGWVTSIGTGYAGVPSEQYYRFMFLLTIMDNTELVQLVNNSAGCLRIYAYMGLYHNKYSGLKEIENILKNDTTRLSTISGCVIEFTSVANAVGRITDWYWEELTKDIFSQLITNKEYRSLEFKNMISLDN